MNPRILITRPEEEAAATAEMVKNCGFDPLCAPVLELRDTGAALPDPSLYNAVIFSSAAGVRAFQAGDSDPRWFSKKVFAVGPHTAAQARQAGFVSLMGGRPWVWPAVLTPALSQGERE